MMSVEITAERSHVIDEDGRRTYKRVFAIDSGGSYALFLWIRLNGKELVGPFTMNDGVDIACPLRRLEFCRSSDRTWPTLVYHNYRREPEKLVEPMLIMTSAKFSSLSDDDVLSLAREFEAKQKFTIFVNHPNYTDHVPVEKLA